MESLCLSLYEMAKRRQFHTDDPGRGGRKGWTLIGNLLCASHRARSLTPMASRNPHCNTGSNRLAPLPATPVQMTRRKDGFMQLGLINAELHSLNL